MSEPSDRHLRRPVLCGEEPEARRPGVDGPGVNVPAVLVRLRAVEAARFELNLLMSDPERHNLIRDVRRVLPVMRKRRLGQLHG